MFIYNVTLLINFLLLDNFRQFKWKLFRFPEQHFFAITLVTSNNVGCICHNVEYFLELMLILHIYPWGLNKKISIVGNYAKVINETCVGRRSYIFLKTAYSIQKSLFQKLESDSGKLTKVDDHKKNDRQRLRHNIFSFFPYKNI